MNKFVTDLCKCGISVVGVLRKVSRYMLIISCLNPLSGKESFRHVKMKANIEVDRMS